MSRRLVLFIIDDIINAIGAQQAAKQQAATEQQALDLQKQIYGQSRADQAPWLQAGQTALGDIHNLLTNPSSIQASPAYQFQLDQGQKALERSAAAKGGLMSGGFAKGLAQYSQGLASNEYGNQFNRLYQLAGMGQGSAQNLGSLGSGYANSASTLLGALGNTRAAGTMAGYGGAANAVASAGNLATLGLGGGLKALGIPGLGGGGGINPGASSLGQSTGYVPNYIPTQTQSYSGFNLPQLSLSGYGGH